MDDLPRIHPTVVHLFAEAVASEPQREALVCGDERLSYAEYGRCVAGFARELVASGAVGRNIGIVLGNSIDICIALFATHAARARTTSCNPGYTARELRAIFEDADLHTVVYAEDRREVVGPVAEALGIAHRVCIGPAARRLTAWRDDASLSLPQPLPAPDALASLQYTGGTTGRSKGVNLTHAAISTNISQREALLPVRRDGVRLLCITPLFHVYASATCLHNMAYALGTLVILPRYTPEAVFETLSRERITHFAGSPTIFTGLMAHPGFASANFSQLELSYSGSAPLPEELLERWEHATGVPVIEGYGQSEAGPVISFNPLHGVRKPGSVGIPVPHTEVQVVDLGAGERVLPVHQKGEIRVRGPQVMAGYRNLPEETAQALRGGWLYTGDIGEFDADGYLYIRDRKKEMAKVSGFNVFPREIEELLYRHPAVQEVAVVAVPDDYRGEAVVAYVVARAGEVATEEDLLAYCRDNLARYKVPVRLEQVDALPKTAVGKLDKVRLRAIACGRD
jgi:long-chain acyl-CoA synthetase